MTTVRYNMAARANEKASLWRGSYVRDLDGHKIEAAFWDESLAPAARH
jgi:hypothetical protein